MHRGWSVLALANKMGFEYYLVVSYEIILYQHCKFSTNYRSAASAVMISMAKKQQLVGHSAVQNI